MRTQSRTGSFWLLLVSAALHVAGCGGGSGPGTVATDTAAGPDTVVTVISYQGARIPNATVVLGNSDGKIQEYGTTDENGQITFTNSPANSTVTAATACLRSGQTTTTYSMNVQYDVNGSVVIRLDDCTPYSYPALITPPGTSSDELGTVTVNLTGMPANVASDQFIIGNHYVYTMFLVTSVTATVHQYDLNDDGTLSVLALGRDANGDDAAYGLAQNRQFTAGMSLDVAMSPMSYLRFDIANLPSAAISLNSSVNLYGQNLPGFGKTITLSSSQSSTTIAIPYIPVSANQTGYAVSVELDRNHDGTVDGMQTIFRSSYVPPADQMFDMSTALSAPSLTVTGANTARPAISWSGADPASQDIDVSIVLHSQAGTLYLSFGDFMRSRTSIHFPELPDSLAAFRPTGIASASIYTYAYEGNDSMTSCGYYEAP